MSTHYTTEQKAVITRELRLRDLHRRGLPANGVDLYDLAGGGEFVTTDELMAADTSTGRVAPCAPLWRIEGESQFR
jgi:hypothetical protein